MTAIKQMLKRLYTLFIGLCCSATLFAQSPINEVSDTSLCMEGTLVIDFPMADYPDYSIFWTNTTYGDSLNIISNSAQLSVNTEDTYWATLTDTSGATLYDSFTFAYDDSTFVLTTDDPDHDIDKVIELCYENNNSLVSPTNPSNIHTWYIDGVEIEDQSANILFFSDIEELEFDTEQNNYVVVENTCGTISSNNTIDVLMNECYCGLKMPNVFSPNPEVDDVNSLFKPFNNDDHYSPEPYIEPICESSNYRLEIYSRWGRHMTTINSGDELPAWDGLNKHGNKAPDGVYFYKVYYVINTFTLAKQMEKTGYFHLFGSAQN